MLLVTMGTQSLQCERIINCIIDANIKDEIVIQSYYKNINNRQIPKNIKIIQFIPYEEMDNYFKKADVIVVSGTGSIFRSLKMNKKTIIFPRLGTYDEAVDDHGLDMIILKEKGFCEFVDDEKKFKEVYENCKKTTFKKFVSNTEKFCLSLEEDLKKL